MIMKRIFLLGFLLCISLIASSLEIGTDFRMGNLAFAYTRNKEDKNFDGNDFSAWGLNFYANHDINENVTIKTSFINDPILRNIAYTQFFYKESILNLGVGPFFGFFNSGLDPILKPGISTIVQLEIPRLIFISFRADSTQNSRLNLENDYTQERTDVKVGFYFPNVICTINLLNRQFTQKTASDEVVDSLNEYSFKAEIFQKNTPYKLFLSFGLENLGKIWSGADVQHYLNSILIGTGLEINFNRAFYVYLDVYHSVYTWGAEALSGIQPPGPMGYMFRGWLGVKVDVDQLLPQGPVS